MKANVLTKTCLAIAISGTLVACGGGGGGSGRAGTQAAHPLRIGGLGPLWDSGNIIRRLKSSRWTPSRS